MFKKVNTEGLTSVKFKIEDFEFYKLAPTVSILLLLYYWKAPKLALYYVTDKEDMILNIFLSIHSTFITQ